MEVEAAAGAIGETGRHSWVQRQTCRAVSELIREEIMTWGKREGPLKAQLCACLVVRNVAASGTRRARGLGPPLSCPDLL